MVAGLVKVAANGVAAKVAAVGAKLRSGAAADPLTSKNHPLAAAAVGDHM